MLNKFRKGFTLFEIVVVLAIIVIIGVISYMNLYSARNHTFVVSAAQQAVATLRQAQSRAISQYNNTAWGVHFDNTNPDHPFYALFSTTAYSTATVANVYTFPYNVEYFPGSVPEGSSVDIFFSPLSGAPSTPLSITVLSPKFTGEISGWSQATPLPWANAGLSAAYYDGYLYAVAGVEGGQSVFYAAVNEDGSLGQWKATASVPNDGGNQYGASIAYNGYLYNVGGMGGTIDNGYSPVVSYAKINSDGSLAGWTETTPLPQGVESPAVAAYNGYLYSMGGLYHSDSGYVNVQDVVYAKINNDGSVGPWSSTSFIPNEITYYPATAYQNGYLYSLGGYYGHSSYVSYLSYAKVNDDGSLGPWTQGDQFPSWWEGFSPVLAKNGYLYSLANGGGYPTPLASIYAKINSDGSVGSWTQTGSLPNPVKYDGVVGTDQYFYLVGGSDPGWGIPTSTVLYTNLLGQSSARIGVDSQGVIGL